MKEKSLKEEIKDVVKEKPSKEERLKEKEAAKKAKHIKKEKRVFFPKRNLYKAMLIIMGIVAVAFLLTMIVADTLPSDLTIVVAFVMLGLLILSDMLFVRDNKKLRVSGIIVTLLFAIIFGAATYYLGTSYAMMNRISTNSVTGTGSNYVSGIYVTKDPFNVYITGIDQWEQEKGEDLERSDVNMLVTVNPVTKKVLLTSIPRDTYVKLHTAQQMDKLTHTGIYGVDETLNTVEDWLGIDIKYYIKMNFSGARDVINAIGGIEFYNPTEFKSSLRGYTYKKGNISLNGKRAVYYARERKAFEGKDSLRVENQQRVMKAILDKMLSSSTILLHYGDVIDATSRNLETNMSTKDIQSLVKMQISDLSEWDIQSQKIEGEADMDYVASLTQSSKFDIYRPDEQSVKKCIGAINAVHNPTEAELEEASKNQNKSFFVNMMRHFKNKEEEEYEPIIP